MRAPIAQRLIPLADQQIGRVVVSVFPPNRGTGGKSYCRYRVGLPTRVVLKTVWGTDTLNALSLALQAVDAEVQAAERSGEIRLDRLPGSCFSAD